MKGKKVHKGKIIKNKRLKFETRAEDKRVREEQGMEGSAL